MQSNSTSGISFFAVFNSVCWRGERFTPFRRSLDQTLWPWTGIQATICGHETKDDCDKNRLLCSENDIQTRTRADGDANVATHTRVLTYGCKWPYNSSARQSRHRHRTHTYGSFLTRRASRPVPLGVHMLLRLGLCEDRTGRDKGSPGGVFTAVEDEGGRGLMADARHSYPSTASQTVFFGHCSICITRRTFSVCRKKNSTRWYHF